MRFIYAYRSKTLRAGVVYVPERQKYRFKFIDRKAFIVPGTKGVVAIVA